MCSLDLVREEGFSSKSRRSIREKRQMIEKSRNTVDQPNIGRIRFATSSPIKEAIAVPMKSKE